MIGWIKQNGTGGFFHDTFKVWYIKSVCFFVRTHIHDKYIYTYIYLYIFSHIRYRRRWLLLLLLRQLLLLLKFPSRKYNRGRKLFVIVLKQKHIETMVELKQVQVHLLIYIWTITTMSNIVNVMCILRFSCFLLSRLRKLKFYIYIYIYSDDWFDNNPYALLHILHVVYIYIYMRWWKRLHTKTTFFIFWCICCHVSDMRKRGHRCIDDPSLSIYI